MTHQATVPASEGHRGFGKLLKRVYDSDEHLIIERDGFPVAVMMSIQEYEKLEQKRTDETISLEGLPPVLSLEEAFGSVTPLNKPEDFEAIREIAVEEHVAKQTE